MMSDRLVSALRLTCGTGLFATMATCAALLAGTSPAAHAAPQAAHTAVNPARAALPKLELTDDILFQVMASEIGLQRGLPGNAFRTYIALARETRDPRFAQRATEIAFTARAVDQALEGARLWSEIDPAAAAPRQLIQSLLISTGQWDEVEPVLAAQLNRAPPAQRGATILLLQRTLSRSPDTAGALGVLERLTVKDRQLPETHLALATARAANKDNAGALAELDRALALRPHYEPAALMAADLRAQENPEAAIASLRAYVQTAPASIDARLALARLYLASERVDEAQQQFEALRARAPNDARVALALGLIQLQQKHYREAEAELQRYLKLAQASKMDADTAYQGLSQAAEEQRDYKAALAWIERIDDERLATATQVKRAQLLGKLQRLDEAQAIFKELGEETANIDDPERRAAMQASLRQAEVGMLLEAGAIDRARARLSALLEAEPNQPDYLYELAMVEERAQRYDVMETLLNRFITLRPDDRQGYNALGYSLADRNTRLQEALQLLEKATQLAPEDPYIMDSLGWVKYRLGDLQTAADLLQRAYDKSPQAEIAAHLGEVLWQLGRRDDAKRTWDKARRLDDESGILKRTLERHGVVLPE